jgi:heme iron utilization protein
MMEKTPENALHAYSRLLAETHSLILATADKEGAPEASTTPFVLDENSDYYIFVSHLARHTRNLEENSQASVMLLEDEGQSQQLFARRRVQLHCMVSRPDPEQQKIIMAQFRTEHGKIFDLLASLPDFVLYRLHPVSGQFVMGFGQAYRLRGDGLTELEQIGPAA